MRGLLEEVDSINQSLKDLSGKLGEYKYRHWRHLSSEARSQIELLEWKLLSCCDDLLSLDSTQERIASIQDDLKSAWELLADPVESRQLINLLNNTLQLGMRT